MIKSYQIAIFLDPVGLPEYIYTTTYMRMRDH